ncbi:hypothetical protein BH11CYA1_BH11CYA1_12640 [soil metagenome]
MSLSHGGACLASSFFSNLDKLTLVGRSNFGVNLQEVCHDKA